MDKVFILGGLRSYIGVRNSAYRHVPAEHLGAAVLKELTARYQPSKIDMIICGNCVGGAATLPVSWRWKQDFQNPFLPLQWTFSALPPWKPS